MSGDLGFSCLAGGLFVHSMAAGSGTRIFLLSSRIQVASGADVMCALCDVLKGVSLRPHLPSFWQLSIYPRSLDLCRHCVSFHCWLPLCEEDQGL